MASHLLSVLEPSVVLQVNRDARCPPGVTSNGGEKTCRLARFRIAAQALYRLKARPVTDVPSELTLWKRGCPLWRPAASMYSLRICSSR